MSATFVGRRALVGVYDDVDAILHDRHGRGLPLAQTDWPTQVLFDCMGVTYRERELEVERRRYERRRGTR